MMNLHRKNGKQILDANAGKRYVIAVLLLTGMLLSGMAAVTIYIDPLLHYHGPLEGISYQFLSGERYANDGITMHWDYNAVITGSSMTECFQASELDELFGVHSIKVPYSGGSFYETGNNLKKAFAAQKDIKMVVRALDSGRIGLEPDYLEKGFAYPDYLTDSDVLNDVHYLLNKAVLMQETIPVCLATLLGTEPMNFDRYANWSENYSYGKDAILSGYVRQKKEHPVQRRLREEEYRTIAQNMEQNVVSIVKQNPDTIFYFFFPPASIVGMDCYYNLGEIEALFETQKYAYELLADYPNAKVFGWNDQYEMICNLDHYKDLWHYSGSVNSQMLRWMREDYGLLTKNSYEDYFSRCADFYKNYHYDSIYQ